MNAVATEVAAGPGTALTIPERVRAAMRSEKTEKDLRELATRFVDITVVTNKDGRQQVHAAYMALKNARIQVEKTGEEARDEAVKVSKGVITEQKRLVAIIAPEETRLQGLRDEWDAIEERARQEAAEKERQRAAAIHARIDAIRAAVNEVAGRSAEILASKIDALRDIVIDEASFAEWAPNATEVREQVVTRLVEMHTERVDFEAEQERLRLQRAEDDRRRNEEEARLAKERERLAVEKAAQDKRDADAREALRLEREALDKVEAERQERLRVEQEARKREDDERQARLDAEERDRQESLRLEQEQRDKDEAARQARIREDEERLAVQRLDVEQEGRFNSAVALIQRVAADGVKGEIANAEDSLLALRTLVIDAGTYGGARAFELCSLRSEKVAAIEAHRDGLLAAIEAAKPVPEPAPPAAAELTAAPSDEGAEAVVAPTVDEPYPGDESIEQAVAAWSGVSHLTARIWLSMYQASQAAA